MRCVAIDISAIDISIKQTQFLLSKCSMRGIYSYKKKMIVYFDTVNGSILETMLSRGRIIKPEWEG